MADRPQANVIGEQRIAALQEAVRKNRTADAPFSTNYLEVLTAQQSLLDAQQVNRRTGSMRYKALSMRIMRWVRNITINKDSHQTLIRHRRTKSKKILYVTTYISMLVMSALRWASFPRYRYSHGCLPN